MQVCEEIKVGDATYLLNRVFIGSRPISEVLADNILSKVREETAVDDAVKLTI